MAVVGAHHRVAERAREHALHHAARGGVVVHQQHAQRRRSAGALVAHRVRRRHVRERGQGRGRHAQQFAPLAPLQHQVVHRGAELLGVQPDLAAEQQQLGRAGVALVLTGEAEVGDAAGEVEQVDQLVGP